MWFSFDPKVLLAAMPPDVRRGLPRRQQSQQGSAAPLVRPSAHTFGPHIRRHSRDKRLLGQSHVVLIGAQKPDQLY